MLATILEDLGKLYEQMDTHLDDAGWVANRVDPECQMPDAVIAALGGWMPAPLLADVGYQSDGIVSESQAQKIKVAPLLG